MLMISCMDDTDTVFSVSNKRKASFENWFELKAVDLYIQRFNRKQIHKIS